MKKILLTAALVAVSAGSAFAFTSTPASVTGITGTPHDLNTRIAQVSGRQKCIFCHTPHNARRAIPLWNRVDPGTNFSLYNVSPTLTSAGKSASWNPGSVSAFCMSCHDGVTAYGAIYNTAQIDTSTGAMTAKMTGFAALGTDLTNDHPIGFSYNAAYSEDTGGTKEARLVAPTAVAGKMNQTNPQVGS